MDITPLIPGDRQVIDSYGPGRFRISGEDHAGGVIVFPERTLAWSVTNFADVTLERLEAVIVAEPAVEVLLIGCGARMQMPPPALREALRARGISCDVMDTGAACRTYNILLSEARRVAAALIPMPVSVT